MMIKKVARSFQINEKEIKIEMSAVFCDMEAAIYLMYTFFVHSSGVSSRWEFIGIFNLILFILYQRDHLGRRRSRRNKFITIHG